MAVYHILKDGSRPKDITGHVVKLSENQPVYDVIRQIERRGKNEIRKIS